MKLSMNLAGADVAAPVVPKIEDIQIFERLYSGPGRRAEADFYALNQEVRKVVAKLRALEGDPKAQMEVRKKNRALLQIEKQMGTIRQRLGALKKKGDEVRANTGVGKKYNPMQAKQILHGIQAEKTKVAERARKLQAKVDKAS